VLPASAVAASSKLGLGKGHSEQHAVGIVQRALDLGVNFIDTAQYYGTETVVGTAIKDRARDTLVISTKHKITRPNGTAFSVPEILAGLDHSLRVLGTDHVDVFCLHTVLPREYDRVIRENRAGAAARKGKRQIPFSRRHRIRRPRPAP